MRYLMAVWDGGGATPPNLGVARLLIERGHEVVVYGDPSVAEGILATGATHRQWPTAPQRVSSAIEDDLLRDWEPATPMGAFARLRDRLVTGASGRFAADVAAAIDEATALAEAGSGAPFDVVLADGMLFGALVAAEARGIPNAALVGSVYLAPNPDRPLFGLGLAPARGPLGRLRDRLGFALTNAGWDTGLRDLNTTRARYGLAPLKHVWSQWDRADRVLILTGAAFDNTAPVPANVRWVGPVLEDLPADGALDLPPGDAPLVVVGLSSSYMQQELLLRHIAVALAQLPVRAVITTGPAIDPADVPAAAHVRVVRAASHTALFEHASLVVTHAGHGTVIKALAAGVPLLCLPIARDQPDNAKRVVRHGAGRVLSKRADASAIAQAVVDMLATPTYAAAAAALGERIRAEIASGVLVAELEALPGRALARERAGETSAQEDPR
ncbi:glycosyltransferase [Agromyces protaetiae]|uniref:Glycosyltransferase n=1 Tax=Agromyces protaetiae TaxID=2509455 RepID=A0A4V0YH53_9MICO|nr:glycosyltransferase [Agromyces protaetiae]QAY73511.1 glycosyltransferase [Agromyces protaetiae]